MQFLKGYTSFKRVDKNKLVDILTLSFIRQKSRFNIRVTSFFYSIILKKQKAILGLFYYILRKR